jgi:hypothetical protein
MDSIIGFITTVLGTLFGYFLSEHSIKRNRFRDASEKLKDAFIDELVKFQRAGIIEIEGTKIYDVLIQSYGKHCAAVERFNVILKGKKFINFNSAWHEYQYPDNKTDNGVFGYYITPDENGKVKMIKPEFVVHKIAPLLDYANP